MYKFLNLNFTNINFDLHRTVLYISDFPRKLWQLF